MLRSAAVLLVASAILIAGCDSGGSTPPPDTNAPPTASAAASATEVEAGETVQLDGTGSSDPDGDALTYEWTLNGPNGSTAALSDASAADPTFVADLEGGYVAALSVSDGQADDSDEVAINASPCPPQMIDSDIATDTTFPDVCFAEDRFDYIVTRPIDINATATFEAGIRVGFEEEAGLRVNDGGAVLAQGTQDAPIWMTGVEDPPGFWRGLYFRADDVTSELDHVFIEHGGHIWGGVDEAATIVVGNDAQLSLTNSVIRNSSSSGIYLETRARLPEFSNNTFEDFNDDDARYPMFIPDVQMGVMDTESSYGDDVLVYSTNNIDEEMAVSPLSLELIPPAYQMSGFFEVNAPVTLDPGVHLRFEPNAGMRVNDGGALIADQDALVIDGVTRRVRFFRADLDTPWRGLLFRADDLPSTLNDVEVSGAGSEAMLELHGTDVAANISVDNDAQLSLTNSLINTRLAAEVHGLFLMPRGGLTTFRSNRFVFQEKAGAAYIPDRQMGKMDEETTILEGNYVRVYPTGDLDRNMTVSPLRRSPRNEQRSRYRLDGFFDVDATITIKPGVEIEFAEAAAVRVNDGGAIIAEGTAEDKIVMTGMEETPGYWRGVLFRADDRSSQLNYVEVAYGGREKFGGVDEPANLAIEPVASLSLNNSIIRNSAGWGTWVDHINFDPLSGSGNSYSANAKGALGKRE